MRDLIIIYTPLCRVWSKIAISGISYANGNNSKGLVDLFVKLSPIKMPKNYTLQMTQS